MSLEAKTKRYLELREQKARLERQLKLDLEPIRNEMQELEVSMLSTLDDLGASSVKTGSGTPYAAVKTQYKVADWDMFFDFVKENALQHMLYRAVSKASVGEYREAHGELPPGLDVYEERVINVRKA